MGRDSRMEGCKSFIFDMKRIHDIYYFKNRYPSSVRGVGLDKVWFTLSRFGFSVGFSAKKSTITIKNSYHAKLYRKDYRDYYFEYFNPRKAFNLNIKKLSRQKLELTKTLPSENLPKERQFVIRFESLEQVAVLFRVYKNTKKDISKLWEISNLWGNDKSRLNNKPGIYLIQNRVNKKMYIGKSNNLLLRLENYSNYDYLNSHINSSNIYRAILKFGFSNFSFSILEFCDEKTISSREQHFINSLKPQYNIRKAVHKNKE